MLVENCVHRVCPIFKHHRDGSGQLVARGQKKFPLLKGNKIVGEQTETMTAQLNHVSTHQRAFLRGKESKGLFAFRNKVSMQNCV